MDRHAIQTRPRQQMLDHSSGPKSKPEPTFDFTQNSNVTALIGKTAYLTCRVRNLGDKTVSWVRHRDIHILTAGAYTYTSDQRFQALHRQNTGHGNEWSDWTLCIKWAQERDQGIYECQISTIPIKSYQFHLNVVVPTATILGGPELYVGAGSTINLTCAIRFSSEPPAYIFWYYNENVLSYDSPRGGVSVITEKGGDVTTSWLLIQTAQPSDSGEYSCKPSNANTASIRVHVLNVQRHPQQYAFHRGIIFPSSPLPLLGLMQKNFNYTWRIATSEMQCSIKTIIRIRLIVIFFIQTILSLCDAVVEERGYACPSFAVNYEYQSNVVEATLPRRSVSHTCFEYLAICASDFTAPV
ncbi:CADM2 protein, partial [Acromyrmex charruanus]